MGGYPGLPEQPRNSGYRGRLWNRRSGGWESTSTVKSDRPQNRVNCPSSRSLFVILLSMWRHSGASSSFLSTLCLWRAGCIVFLRRCSTKENDNDAHLTIRDCLAQPETTSTPATLGADQARFRNSSLSGSGTGFNPCRIVLGDYVQFGNSTRWLCCLVMPVARKKSAVGQSVMKSKSMIGTFFKLLLIFAQTLIAGAQTPQNDNPFRTVAARSTGWW